MVGSLTIPGCRNTPGAPAISSPCRCKMPSGSVDSFGADSAKKRDFAPWGRWTRLPQSVIRDGGRSQADGALMLGRGMILGGPRACSTVVPFPFFRTRCCFEAGNPGHLLRLVQNAGVVLTDGNSRRCQSPKNGKRKSPQGLGSARRGSTQEVARGISCGMCRPRVAVGEARPRAHHPDTWARHWAAAMPPTTWQFSLLGEAVLPTRVIRCRGGCVDEVFLASSLTAPREPPTSLGGNR